MDVSFPIAGVQFSTDTQITGAGVSYPTSGASITASGVNLTGAVPSWILAGSTIDLNFATSQYFGGTPSTLLSVSRASSGYALNSNGSLTLFGNNTPRIGSGTGLLIEEARTNLILQSQTFSNASWIKTNSTATDNQSVAPDGNTTAATFSGTAAGTTTYAVSQSIVASSATTVSYSVYVAPGTTSFVALAIGQNAGNFATAVFDLTNVSATSASQTSVGGTSGTIVSTSQTKLGGYFRISIVAAISVANPFLNIEQAASATGNTFSANGDVNNAPQSKTLTIWGAQAEAASFSSSYITTTSATASRAADNVLLAGAALSATVGSKAFSAVVATSAGSPNANAGNGIDLLFAGNSTHHYLVVLAGQPTIITARISPTNISASLGSGSYASTAVKAGMSYDGVSAVTVVGNNGTVATGSLVYNTNETPTLGSTAGNSYVDTYISRMTLWSSKLADATLKAFTQ